MVHAGGKIAFGVLLSFVSVQAFGNVNCYEHLLGLNPTLKEIPIGQRAVLESVPVPVCEESRPEPRLENRSHCLSLHCSLEFTKTFNASNISNASVAKQDGTLPGVSEEDPLIRHYHHLNGMQFYQVPYYQKGSAVFRIITAQVFRHFLPYSPRAVFVFDDGKDGERFFTGIAIERVEAVQLVDNQHAIQNQAYNVAMGLLQDATTSKADPNPTLNKINEWTALAQYLQLPAELADIVVTASSQEVASLNYFGAMEKAHYHNLKCLTTSDHVSFAYQCDEQEMESMRGKISAGKDVIRRIVENTFAVLARQFPNDNFDGYKPYVIGILGL